MTYQVVLTPAAARELRNAEPALRDRIESALRNLQDTPRPVGVVKLATSRNDWRLRMGDYRCLYEIDDDASLVTVWRIAHRREAYR